MAAPLQCTIFAADGSVIGTSRKILPDWLDWGTIEVKEIWLKYVGGLPPEAAFVYIESQGGRKLITEVPEEMTQPLDNATYKRKLEHGQAYLESECDRLGIHRRRAPANQ